ncbi:MAG: energy transducer TonB [Candidatus Acidiferrales bacterium]
MKKQGIVLVLMLALAAGAALAQSRRAQDYAPPRVLATVDANYPPTSIAGGTVVLQVAVSEAGAITEVEVVGDIPSLTVAAERAVRQWKFAPAELNGRPVASTVIVAVSFTRPVLNPPPPKPLE